MAIGLTQRQMDLLRYIAGYQQAHDGISPSFAECRDALGLSTKGGIYRMLDGLEQRGAISRMHYRERAIRVLARVRLPRAPDGAPLYAVPFKAAGHGA